MKQVTGFIVFVLLCMTTLSYGQQKVNLATILQEQQIKAVNRTGEFENEIPDPPADSVSCVFLQIK
ncbi:MAG: hypothetical protein U9R49_05880 [Bacteroidota bacterium]|nr:hypothetical protein [Bacteroidota bacterium]